MIIGEFISKLDSQRLEAIGGRFFSCTLLAMIDEKGSRILTTLSTFITFISTLQREISTDSHHLYTDNVNKFFIFLNNLIIY